MGQRDQATGRVVPQDAHWSHACGMNVECSQLNSLNKSDLSNLRMCNPEEIRQAVLTCTQKYTAS